MISLSAVFRSSLTSSIDDRTLLGSRANNLNAVRLVLAGMVMFSHSFVLSYGSEYGDPLSRLTGGQESFGSIAVDLFFVISGLLITASWLRSKSMNDFLLRRVLRIYPGFVVALAFSALLTWILCPEFWQHIGNGLGWTEAFLADATTLSIKSMQWPGTFARNPFPGASNGSLWSIQPEFECYLLVAGIGLLFLFKRRMLILITTGALCARFAFGILHTGDPGHQSNRLYLYFLMGMLTWLFRDKIKFSLLSALGCIVVLLVSTRFTPVFSLLFVIAGSYATLSIGLSKPWRLTRWTEKTDISYGVYLYAFPVQQVVAMYPGMRTAIVNLLISVPVTVILALLSWHFVEHRFLKMKSVHFVDYDPAMQH